MSDIDLRVNAGTDQPIYITDAKDQVITTGTAYDPYKLTVSVTSEQPTTTETFDIAIFINGNLFSLTTHTPTANGNINKAYNWKFPFQPGTYEITLVVDPENKIEEKDETNNTYTMNFTVNGNSNWLMNTTWSQSGYFLQ
jgi:subtilase family serine protease